MTRNRTHTSLTTTVPAIFLTAALVLSIWASQSSANIYRWDNGELLTTTDAVPGANLSSMNLNFADLMVVDLTGATFEGTNLIDAQLVGCTLVGTNFSEALIHGATFREVSGLTGEQVYATASYINKNLSGVDFQYSDVSGWDFNGQDLTDSSFYRATAAGVDFSGANMAGSNFGEGDLTGANFTNTNLTSANLTEFVAGADFTDATINGAYVRGNSGDFTNGQLISTASYKTKDLSGTTLSSLDLPGCDFRDFNLKGASFKRTVLTGADFTDADIKEASFTSATGRGFTKEMLYSTASYKDKDLSGTTFLDNNMTGWSFRGQNLTDSHFEVAVLTNADFTDAEIKGATIPADSPVDDGITADQLYSTRSYKNKVLTGIDLRYTDLSGWSFRDQDVRGASFRRCDFHNTDFTDATIDGVGFGHATSNGFTKEQFYSTASYKNKRLQGIDLSDNDLSGWDFRNMDLTDAAFGDTRLTNADFTGAVIKGAGFSSEVLGDLFTVAQLYSTTSYRQRDLVGFGIRWGGTGYWNGPDWTGIDLRGQDLSDSGFFYMNLANADLRGAILTNAFFKEANLEGWDLTATILKDIDFSDQYTGDTILPVFRVSLAVASGATETISTATHYDESVGIASGGTLTLDAPLTAAGGINIAGGAVLQASVSTTVMGDTVNGGQVHGPSGPDVLRFWGPVSGAGSYTGNVAFASEFSPGSSSAIVSLENVEFGDISTLVMEIGGLTPGGEYDRLDISGELQPGGTLQVVLIDDFIPQTGDTFDILDWGALAAIAFETVELPGPGRVTWDTSTLYTTGRISVLTLMDDGDTDGDRDVDGEDFDTLAGTFGGSDDLRADFNLDGVVDLVDFAILRALFSTGGSAPAAPDNSATTPEPATVALLAMSGLAVLRRRKK